MDLTLLGTGNALVTRCYNTCFLLSEGDDQLLVDGGGGNTILSQLEQKTSTGLQREDIIPLLLSPLMAEKPEQKNRIMDGIHILKKAESSFSRREVQKMEAILYAFAVKFLNNEDLTVVKKASVSGVKKVNASVKRKLLNATAG